MTTIVEAPPEPSHDELEALIEEARRRARRRRLVIGGAVVGALLLAGLVTALVVVFTDGTSTAVPPGFHVVRARGPVRHVLVETITPVVGKTLNLAAGRESPARETDEIWWDQGSGLARFVVRYDGRVYADYVEQRCPGQGKRLGCIPPEPFDVDMRGLTLPPRTNAARVVGSGRFRGHRVVWVEGLVQPGKGQRPYLNGSQVAYDAITHRRLALRDFIGGHHSPPGLHRRPEIWLRALKPLPNVDPKRVSFVVPDGGADLNAPGDDTQIRTPGLTAAREVVGATPLWLGRSFQGHRLRSVVAGDEAELYQNGRRLRPARIAQFDYGSFSLKQSRQAPPSGPMRLAEEGTVFMDAYRASFSRSGFYILVQAKRPIDRSFVLAVVKALRPVDG